MSKGSINNIRFNTYKKDNPRIQTEFEWVEKKKGVKKKYLVLFKTVKERDRVTCRLVIKT